MLFDILSMIGDAEPLDIVKTAVFAILAILVAIVCHEAAHALMAYWMGDSTARSDGRISLNPMNHLNLPGFLMLLVFGFGWANPVQINSRNFRKPRLGIILTSAAGPLANFILSFLFCLLYYIADIQSMMTGADVWDNVGLLCYYLLAYNASLGLFNLIPVPPLDGSKILAELLPFKLRYKYYQLERYSTIIFVVMIVILNRTNFLSVLMSGLLRFFSMLIMPILDLIYGGIL